MAEATWTISRRGGYLGKNKHCQEENHRTGGGWVYFTNVCIFWVVAVEVEVRSCAGIDFRSFGAVLTIYSCF